MSNSFPLPRVQTFSFPLRWTTTSFPSSRMFALQPPPSAGGHCSPLSVEHTKHLRLLQHWPWKTRRPSVRSGPMPWKVGMRVVCRPGMSRLVLPKASWIAQRRKNWAMKDHPWGLIAGNPLLITENIRICSLSKGDGLMFSFDGCRWPGSRLWRWDNST